MARKGNDQSERTRLSILLFTDIVGSTDLKSRLGTSRYRPILARHNRIFETLAKQFAECEILKHTGDGYFVAFAKASDAVRFALLFQSAMRKEKWEPAPIATRVGIHAGEVALMTMAGRQDVIGLAADLAARLMSLAEGGQILLTRGAFDDARQFIDAHPDDGSGDVPKVRWVAHGGYLCNGSDQAIEVYEVGAEDRAPLRAPPDAEKAKRVTPEALRKQLGWRPAAGQTVPNRPDWRLVKTLPRRR